MLTKNNVFLPDIHYFIKRKATPSWQIKKDRINFHDLTYIYRGKAIYFVDGVRYELKEGDVIYIPRGSTRQATTHPDEKMHSYAFNFDINSTDNDVDTLPLPIAMSMPKDPYFMQLLQEYNIVWLERKDGFKIRAVGLFLVILHHLYTRSSPQNEPMPAVDQRVERIKEYILNNYHRKITKEELSDLVQLHPVYMGSLFRKKAEYTINEYTQRIRINKACDMLSTDEYSVNETALRCGFDDIFYFSKVFKRITGFPPSAWSKSMTIQ
ncbi:MAG TPA: AraC family transcriptional regulator [Bacillota bacterium]|nr:AraC family transcriptional regulator [Bacillota bacterium]